MYLSLIFHYHDCKMLTSGLYHQAWARSPLYRCLGKWMNLPTNYDLIWQTSQVLKVGGVSGANYGSDWLLAPLTPPDLDLRTSTNDRHDWQKGWLINLLGWSIAGSLTAKKIVQQFILSEWWHSTSTLHKIQATSTEQSYIFFRLNTGIDLKLGWSTEDNPGT